MTDNMPTPREIAGAMYEERSIALDAECQYRQRMYNGHSYKPTVAAQLRAEYDRIDAEINAYLAAHPEAVAEYDRETAERIAAAERA